MTVLRFIHPCITAMWRTLRAVDADAHHQPPDPMSLATASSNVPRWTTGAAGIALIGALLGSAIAVAELNAVILGVSLLACIFVLIDFRVGVVLLIVLMPISASAVFPHAMLGITGLNPLNLLLLATLGSYLLRALADGSVARLVPRPLLWLYLVPIVIAGALGSRHIGEIAPFLLFDEVQYDSAGGYLRDVVVKPLFMVVFALLVAAAVSRARDPERFLVPILVSIGMMILMVLVFVARSGVGLDQLASSRSRAFLSPLGLHANDLGRLYATAYALLLFTWAATQERTLRLVLFAAMGLVVAALVLTFSRGAFFAFFVVNGLFLVSRRSAGALALGALLVAGLLLALPGAFYDRLGTGFGDGLNAISAGRLNGIWLPLLPELWRSPIYGNGLGSILWSDAMRAGQILATTHPHNAYLRTLLDMGVVGLVLLCAYFAHVWKGFRALSVEPSLSATLRGFYLGAAAGLASLLIGGIADSSLTPAPEQVFLWLAIGMMYGQRAKAPAV